MSKTILLKSGTIINEGTKNEVQQHCEKLRKQLNLVDEPFQKEQIQDRINSGQNQRYDIQEELPVHLIYMTAWVDASGEIQFRDDVYGKDKIHREAIEKL